MTELKNVARYVTDKIDVALLNTPEYITTDNIIPNRGGVTECDSLPQAVRVTRYAPGDTLVSNIRPYFKKIWYADRVSGCSNDVIVFRPINENWDHKFLYYVLSQDAFFDHMMSGANGTKMPRGNKKTIPDFLVPDFDYEKQTRISETLSAYDDLIENNQKQIKLLKEAAQRLYKEWFVDLRFPGYEKTPIVDGVPEGWSLRPISDFGEIVTGKTPSTEKKEYYGGDIPFVKIPDMHGCVYPVITESSLTEAGAKTQINKFIPRNSIMVSCIATVGLVNIAVERCQTNQQINSIILSDERNLYFVFSAMKRLKELLEGVGSNGATMTNVNKTKFASLPVLYPSEELRNSYFRFCKPIFEKIFNLSLSVVRLKKARDRLLPKLMSGEIEV